MRTIGHAKITRWVTLLENDLGHLREHLAAINTKLSTLDGDDKDVSKIRAEYDRSKYRYELAPSSKEAVERQIQEDEEMLRMLNDEIAQMSFEFGFKTQPEQGTPFKGLVKD